MDALTLPSGRITNPRQRLLTFCQAEYAYCDAIPSTDPEHIQPLDVLVTVAMNSFVNDAVTVRRVHQLSGSRYTVLAQGQLCQSCHMQAKANDYVFTKRQRCLRPLRRCSSALPPHPESSNAAEDQDDSDDEADEPYEQHEEDADHDETEPDDEVRGHGATIRRTSPKSSSGYPDRTFSKAAIARSRCSRSSAADI